MNTKNLVIALLAVAGAALTTTSANAQSYSQGDLLMGFRDPGKTQDYVIDLGPASGFLGQSQGFSETLSLGNISTDLTTVFGSSWATDGSLYWGVAGSTAARVLFASSEELTLGTVTTPWNEATFSGQGLPAGSINSVGTGFNTASSNATNAYIQNTSDTHSWASYVNSSSAFSYFQPQFEGNDPTNGITNTALDLFEMNPATGAGHQGTYEGTFSIASNGNVTYSVVPEPSTYATVLLGAGILFVVTRRRRMAQA